MAIQNGFFKSINGDRRYLAEFFTSYFASFIGNGVFPNPSTNLQVINNQNFSTIVRPGKGWINGHYLNNDDNIVINHQPPDGVLRRIDRIVFSVNLDSRSMDIYLKQGTPSSSAVAPTLVRNSTLYELALADISFNPGMVSISQSNITDQRMNGNLCGIVHGVVEQLDTTTLFNQYQQFLVEKGVEFDQQLAVNQQVFDDWFAQLNDILDGDVAANLANMIITHANNATPQKHIEVVNEIPSNLANKGLLLVVDDVDNPNNAPEIPTSVVLNNRINEVSQNLQQNVAEIQRLDSTKASKTEVNALAAVKADRTYVDSLLGSLSGGGPRDVYYSINALLSAFPNGEMGTYLVFDTSFTDGAHSYIYTDGTWTDLGVYQANNIIDNSVNPNSLTENIKDFIFEDILSYTQFVIGTISTSSGANVVSDTRIRSNFIRVNKGSYLKFNRENLREYAIFVYGDSYNFLSSTTFLSSTYYEISDDSYVRIVMRNRNNAIIETSEINSFVSSISLYARKNIAEISNKAFLSEFTDEGKNLFNKQAAEQGRFIRASDGGVGTSADYYASSIIPVEPSQTITLTQDYQLALYDRFGNFIQGRAAGSGKTFTIPDGVYQLRTSVQKDFINKFQVEVNSVETSYETYRGNYIKQNLLIANKLNGKKWGYCGDSIVTLGYRAGGFEYPGRIAMENGMTLNSLAVPGSMIAKSNIAGHTDTHMSERVLLLDDDCDFVTVMGGTNDTRNNRPLGVFGSTDITTFYGALDVMCRNLYAKFPNKPKIIFTPIKLRGRNQDLKLRVDAIKEVAAFYSIPVCDLSNNGMLQPDIDSINSVYFYNSDGVHPLENGHGILKPFVQNYLLSIL